MIVYKSQIVYNSHFFDLKFITINIFSTALFGLYSLKGFEGISSLANNVIPPPELLLLSWLKWNIRIINRKLV